MAKRRQDADRIFNLLEVFIFFPLENSFDRAKFYEIFY